MKGTPEKVVSQRVMVPSTPGSPRRSRNPLYAFESGGGPDHDESAMRTARWEGQLAPPEAFRQPQLWDNESTVGNGNGNNANGDRNLADRRDTVVAPIAVLSPAHSAPTTTPPPTTTYPARSYICGNLSTTVVLLGAWAVLFFACCVPAWEWYRDIEDIVIGGVVVFDSDDSARRLLIAAVGAMVSSCCLALLGCIALLHMACGHVQCALGCATPFLICSWAGAGVYTGTMSYHLSQIDGASTRAEVAGYGTFASAFIVAVAGGVLFTASVKPPSTSYVVPMKAQSSQSFVSIFFRENVATLVACFATVVFQVFGVVVPLWGGPVVEYSPVDEDRLETWSDTAAISGATAAVMFSALICAVLAPLLCGRREHSSMVVILLTVVSSLSILATAGARICVAAELWKHWDSAKKFEDTGSIAGGSIFALGALLSACATL